MKLDFSNLFYYLFLFILFTSFLSSANEKNSPNPPNPGNSPIENILKNEIEKMKTKIDRIDKVVNNLHQIFLKNEKNDNINSILHNLVQQISFINNTLSLFNISTLTPTESLSSSPLTNEIESIQKQLQLISESLKDFQKGQQQDENKIIESTLNSILSNLNNSYSMITSLHEKLTIVEQKVIAFENEIPKPQPQADQENNLSSISSVLSSLKETLTDPYFPQHHSSLLSHHSNLLESHQSSLNKMEGMLENLSQLQSSPKNVQDEDKQSFLKGNEIQTLILALNDKVHSQEEKISELTLSVKLLHEQHQTFVTQSFKHFEQLFNHQNELLDRFNKTFSSRRNLQNFINRIMHIPIWAYHSVSNLSSPIITYLINETQHFSLSSFQSSFQSSFFVTFFTLKEYYYILHDKIYENLVNTQYFNNMVDSKLHLMSTIILFLFIIIITVIFFILISILKSFLKNCCSCCCPCLRRKKKHQNRNENKSYVSSSIR